MYRYYALQPAWRTAFCSVFCTPTGWLAISPNFMALLLRQALSWYGLSSCTVVAVHTSGQHNVVQSEIYGTSYSGCKLIACLTRCNPLQQFELGSLSAAADRNPSLHPLAHVPLEGALTLPTRKTCSGGHVIYELYPGISRERPDRQNIVAVERRFMSMTSFGIP